ncbi:MAG TPA: hypothetical protein VKZ53_08310 [Candidatus Angelobacter sp.]|nr:hypothetical protein [Candidatus Angelobacter sp.]
MILILARPRDPHGDRMAEFLDRKNVEYLRLDTGGIPQGIPHSIRYSGQTCSPLLRVEGRTVDLNEVRAVWNHRQAPANPSEQMNPADREFAFGECAHFVHGLWLLLKDRFWVNPLQAGQAAENKAYQLKVAESVGLAVPRTLMTNEPEEAVAFFDECHGRMIYKAFNQYNRPGPDGRYLGIYTNVVTKDDLWSRREQIRLAPCIFQEYVPKKLELRITAIGCQLFTVAIDAQGSSRGKEDWRHFDHDNTNYQVFEMPETIKAAIHGLLDRLGLVFGGIDVVLTPDGRFVFLEVNQVCQWHWVEMLTGLPLLANFAEMLIQATPSYQPPQALLESAVTAG